VPQIDPKTLESLLWETDGRRTSRDLDTNTDEGAAAVLATACRRISLLRYDASLNLWLLAAAWIAIATGAMLAAVYGDFVQSVEAWYEWPLVWASSFGLVGIALTVVYGVTFFLHDAWWQRFGRGRRDADFYGDPLSRRAGAARP
jgi:hypothetical protein